MDMPREATLFDEAKGSPLRGYVLLKGRGSANIPLSWIERARKSRKSREVNAGKLMRAGKPWNILELEDWEEAFRKECFYLGIRVLLELERQGKSKL
jgi:hypothetical protein